MMSTQIQLSNMDEKRIETERGFHYDSFRSKTPWFLNLFLSPTLSMIRMMAYLAGLWH